MATPNTIWGPPLAAARRRNPHLAARYTAPDPWPNAPDPTAPPPPPGTPALRDVPRLAAQNFGPDLGGMISDAVTGVTHQALQSGRDIADPNSPLWYKLARTAAPFMPTVSAPYLGGAAMEDAAHQQASGLINRWISQPGEPLGSQAKRTLAYHPAQASADAAMAFAPGEGYASALADAAKVPGAGGVALRTALRAGDTARRVVNPVEGATWAAGKTLRGAQGLIRGAGLIDGKTGLLTPYGLAQVKKIGATATPGLQDADYADPRVQRQIAQTIRAKGLTPASLKESVLNYNGAPTPTGPITGVQPPKGAPTRDTAGLINQARSALNQRIGNIAQKTDGSVPSAQEVHDLANSPPPKLGLKPSDTTDLRMAASGHDVLDTPMDAPSPVSQWGPRIARGAAAAGIGWAAPHVLPILHSIPFADVAGSAAAAVGEQAWEHFDKARKAGQVAVGAPDVARALNAPASLAEAGRTVAGAAPYVHGIAPAPPAQPPPQPPADEPTAPSAIEFGGALDEPKPDAKPLPPLKAGEADPWPNAPDPTKGGPGAAAEAAPAEEEEKPSNIQFAEGGRVGFAEGGQVGALTEQLLKRANVAQQAARSSTRPLLGLSDDVVAKALAVAQRGV